VPAFFEEKIPTPMFNSNTILQTTQEKMYNYLMQDNSTAHTANISMIAPETIISEVLKHMDYGLLDI
jgi:hypothetical protein